MKAIPIGIIVLYLFAHSCLFAQSFPDLQKNPLLTASELDSLAKIIKLDNLKPVYYTTVEGYRYTTDPPNFSDFKGYGCKGDFNNDDIADYALMLRNLRKNTDKLIVFITGSDTSYTLGSYPAFKKISDYPPAFRTIGPPICYKKSASGKFISLYGMENEMPGDLIRFNWYSFVWNKENGFTKILTSD